MKPVKDGDTRILDHISALVQEEQQLYATKDTLSGTDSERLQRLQVELDQYWDLLRQRRALREFGQDPDQARVRPASVVEKYEQ
jgi:hypothetical protein